MNKEQLLLELKTVIMLLRDSGAEFLIDPKSKKRIENLRSEIDNLNSCDSLWFIDNYEKWFKEEFAPTIKKNQRKETSKLLTDLIDKL